MEVKKKRCRRKRIRRFRLLKPIEFKALLITAVIVFVAIVLFDSTKEHRMQIKSNAQKLIYKQVMEIADEEKAKYIQLKKEGKEYPSYDRLPPEIKEKIKKEYNSFKKMEN